MSAPIESLIQRLSNNGFLQYEKNKIKPLACRTLALLPTINLIIRYRSILNGYLQYYSFVDNIRKLKMIYNILRASLEKTICFKEKLTKVSFHKIYGKDISVDITNKYGTKLRLDFPAPILEFTPRKFLFNDIKDPLFSSPPS